MILIIPQSAPQVLKLLFKYILTETNIIKYAYLNKE